MNAGLGNLGVGVMQKINSYCNHFFYFGGTAGSIATAKGAPFEGLPNAAGVGAINCLVFHFRLFRNE